MKKVGIHSGMREIFYNIYLSVYGCIYLRMMPGFPVSLKISLNNLYF